MTKSSNTERAQKINTAVALRKKSNSLAEAADALSTQYGISKRQAYRYVKEAESTGRQIPVPDQKIAFTVKLSENLVDTLRQHAKIKEQALSEVVTQALEAFLCKGRRRGKAEGNRESN
jgi:predicted DNA-binding transcriptional regulator YafY